MKRETFFKKFELLADAPGAVGKMRELVLELAVQGKLSERQDSDQKDEVWCSFVPEFDQRMPTLDPLLPFEIPDTWRWVCLDDLGTSRVRNNVADETHASFVPMALIPTGYGMSSQSEARTWGEIKKGFTHFADGDVVMAKITPCFENAKSAVMRNLVNGIGAGTTELHVFRKNTDAVLQEYILIYLKTRGFISRGEPQMTGSAGQKRVPRDYFSRSPIPLPPLAEQKRIVAKVDELMALCDRLEAQQQERESRHTALARASLARFADAPTPANLSFLFHPAYTISPADLRKSILTLAVQGKLVPQDPDDSDARDMINRAMEKRKQIIKSKSLRRKELDESADLFQHEDFPLSWCVERFANIVDPENTISYGVLVPGNDVPNGVPFVRAQDLCLSNHPPRPNKTIAPEIEKPYARTRLIGGEILLCVVGSIGKLGIVPDSWAGANIARAVARIKPIPDVLCDYLLLVLQEQSVQNYFASTTRTLAQPTLNVGMIEQTPIPIPPLAEQRRIVAKVDQLMALVDELEAQLAASSATAENLLKALVAELTGTLKGRKVSASTAKSVAPAPRPPSQEAPAAPTKPAAPAPHPAPAAPASPAKSQTARSLAELRKAAGLTQSAVAKAMGLNQAYISQMETGKRPITEEQRQQLAKILGATPEMIRI